MIQISKLPLIINPEIFFSADKILFVDIMDVDKAPVFIKYKLETKFGAFRYKTKLYLPVTLKGSPENLFLKVKEGIPFDFGEGFTTVFLFDGELKEALKENKIYDFSNHYKKGKDDFAKEIDFLIERYIMPYQSKK
jgi:hypothetical protein